ncbi:MAG: hypothetical protein AB7E72_04825 [Lysobacterales bacterium]
MRPYLWPLALLPWLPADAAVMVVDTGADTALSACTAAAFDCSLRGALLAANATPELDDIQFDIPASDPSFQPATASWRIEVSNSALPLIEAPVVIDGYTQPGASANTQTPLQGGLNAVLKIELRLVNSNGFNGLEISGNFPAQAASTIRGLAISRFMNQIVLTGNAAHRIEGCFLGTDISGSQPASTPTQGRGIFGFGSGPYVIGGSTPAARNLISAMSGAYFTFAPANGLVIQGNLIGTDKSGLQPLGHSSNALEFTAPLTNALIGGSDGQARNVVAATRFTALYLSSSGANAYLGTRVLGNYFGVGVDGLTPLGNGINSASPSQPQPTISVFSGSQCRLDIGGEAPGEANLIAHGGAAGILVSACTGLSAPLNRYRNNRSIAFDLSATSNADGATVNDPADADEGGNRLINYPELSLPAGFAPGGGGTASLTVRVDSAPASVSYPLTVRAYRGDCGGGSRELLGSTQIQLVDAQLPQTWVLSAVDGSNLLPLTLTTTDATGNASEFSPMQGDAVFADALEDSAPTLTVGRCR